MKTKSRVPVSLPSSSPQLLLKKFSSSNLSLPKLSNHPISSARALRVPLFSPSFLPPPLSSPTFLLLDVAIPSLLIGNLSRRHRLVDPTRLRRGRQDVRSGLFIIPSNFLFPILIIEINNPRSLMDSLITRRDYSIYTMDINPYFIDLVSKSILR